MLFFYIAGAVLHQRAGEERLHAPHNQRGAHSQGTAARHCVWLPDPDHLRQQEAPASSGGVHRTCLQDDGADARNRSVL